MGSRKVTSWLLFADNGELWELMVKINHGYSMFIHVLKMADNLCSDGHKLIN